MSEMKIICEDKVIDLSKFETVSYRESFLGSSEGYPVEATRHEQSGFLGGTTTVSEEIIRFRDEESAKKLTKAIAKKWIEKADFFDVEEWLNKIN